MLAGIMARKPAILAAILDELEGFYGRPPRPALRDPFRMVLHRLSGYPQSDRNCDRGYAALRRQFGTAPAALLAANPSTLAQALRAGGIVPELRAERIRAAAARLQQEFGGTLKPVLKLPLKAALKILQSFPTLGAAGAEKILLYNGLPVAAVPSNCIHVPLRLGLGTGGSNWAAGYKAAQAAIRAALPDDAPGQLRAYLLLKRHGAQLCKANRPLCPACPLRSACAYYAATA